MTDDLARRLALPKWLFKQGQEALRRPGPYASGLATSHFHDSIETFCHVLGEKDGIDIPKQGTFHDILAKISKKHSHVQGHTASLRRLNQSRVGFKHKGILVTKEDAASFEQTCHAFLLETSRKVWNIDFDQISLIDVIGHRRTQNYLHKAIDALQSHDLESSVEHSAKAFAIVIHRYRRTNPFPRRKGYTFWQAMHRTVLPHMAGGGHDAYRNTLSALGALLDSEFIELQMYMEAIGLGINLSRFHAFHSSTPLAQVMTNNSVVISQSRTERRYIPLLPDLSTETAEFCVEFVVEAALSVKDTGAYGYAEIGAGRTLLEVALDKRGGVQERVVIGQCDIVVWPEGDGVEVVRTVGPGEAVEVVPDVGLPGQKFPEHLSVLQDGEVAFVRKEHVAVADGVGR